MDVNNINSNINSLNSSNNYQVNKNENSSKIDNSSDFLRLTINEYNQKRDELSESLQVFNEGIGLSKVAIQGLEKQEKYLNNVKAKLENIEQENLEDKNIIKNEINKELLNFKEEAFQTRYKNEKILVQDEYEQDLNISISTKEAYFSIEKPDTPQIVTKIAQEVSKNDFNNEQNLKLVKDQVSLGIREIESLKENFSILNENLENSAKDSIKEQINLSEQNFKNKNINFGKEMNDFSKSNVTSNVGYLITSQANIVQEQSVRLLSK